MQITVLVLPGAMPVHGWSGGTCVACQGAAVAPQILVELAGLQDQEVGDGTTSVVICAAELLKRANDLVRNKIHPTSIISGYRLAMREVGACTHASAEHDNVDVLRWYRGVLRHDRHGISIGGQPAALANATMLRTTCRRASSLRRTWPSRWTRWARKR